MKTSIIILTFNKLEYTKKCVESIRKYTDSKTYEIIVVDNCSTDGTPQWLLKQGDIVKILNNENLGFPKGCNQGLEIATGDNLLLLNNDVIVTPNWLPNLIKALYCSSKVGAVGPVTNHASYGQKIDVDYESDEGIIPFSRSYNVSDASKWKKRLKLIGFCLLFKREVFEEVGYLDERFTPGNYEDDDYCIRIIRKGYELLVCEDTFIHHYGSMSFGKESETLKQLYLTNYSKFKQKWKIDPVYDYGIKYELLQFVQPESVEKRLNVLAIGAKSGGTILELINNYPNTQVDVIEENCYAALSVSNFANVVSVSKNDIEHLQRNNYDYILIEEAINYIENPNSLLLKLKQMLKKEGKLIGIIENKMYYKKVFNLLEGKRSLENDSEGDKIVNRLYNAYEITELFLQCGYHNVKVAGVRSDTIEEDEYQKILIIKDFVPQTELNYFLYSGYVVIGMKE